MTWVGDGVPNKLQKHETERGDKCETNKILESCPNINLGNSRSPNKQDGTSRIDCSRCHPSGYLDMSSKQRTHQLQATRTQDNWHMGQSTKIKVGVSTFMKSPHGGGSQKKSTRHSWTLWFSTPKGHHCENGKYPEMENNGHWFSCWHVSTYMYMYMFMNMFLYMGPLCAEAYDDEVQSIWTLPELQTITTVLSGMLQTFATKEDRINYFRVRVRVDSHKLCVKIFGVTV